MQRQNRSELIVHDPLKMSSHTATYHISSSQEAGGLPIHLDICSTVFTYIMLCADVYHNIASHIIIRCCTSPTMYPLPIRSHTHTHTRKPFNDMHTQVSVCSPRSSRCYHIVRLARTLQHTGMTHSHTHPCTRTHPKHVVNLRPLVFDLLMGTTGVYAFWCAACTATAIIAGSAGHLGRYNAITFTNNLRAVTVSTVTARPKSPSSPMPHCGDALSSAGTGPFGSTVVRVTQFAVAWPARPCQRRQFTWAYRARSLSLVHMT